MVLSRFNCLLNFLLDIYFTLFTPSHLPFSNLQMNRFLHVCMVDLLEGFIVLVRGHLSLKILKLFPGRVVLMLRLGFYARVNGTHKVDMLKLDRMTFLSQINVRVRSQGW